MFPFVQLSICRETTQSIYPRLLVSRLVLLYMTCLVFEAPDAAREGVLVDLDGVNDALRLVSVSQRRHRLLQVTRSRPVPQDARYRGGRKGGTDGKWPQKYINTTTVVS